jgi:hypothetical protein
MRATELVPTMQSPRPRLVEPFVDAEQPALLRSLRRSSREGDYTRWESLRGELTGMGYRVVTMRGVEHLRPLAG